MTFNFTGNFKFIAVIVSIVIFMIVMYGYNRAEKRKTPSQLTERQKQALQAYKRPDLSKSAGCGCGGSPK